MVDASLMFVRWISWLKLLRYVKRLSSIGTDGGSWIRKHGEERGWGGRQVMKRAQEATVRYQPIYTLQLCMPETDRVSVNAVRSQFKERSGDVVDTLLAVLACKLHVG